MSVPRPAMLVAMVTAPMRPAWATISASRAAYSGLALSKLVLDAALPQQVAELLRFLDVGGADEHRPAFLVDLDDLVDDRVPLFLLERIDQVRSS